MWHYWHSQRCTTIATIKFQKFSTTQTEILYAFTNNVPPLLPYPWKPLFSLSTNMLVIDISCMRCMICKFSLITLVVFHILDSVLWCTVLILMTLFFTFYWFLYISKNPLTNQRSWRSSLCFIPWIWRL